MKEILKKYLLYGEIYAAIFMVVDTITFTFLRTDHIFSATGSADCGGILRPCKKQKRLHLQPLLFFVLCPLSD